MRFSDLLATAFLNLWRRKLRAFLTVLGMVIGTSSIVVMVSLGIGMRESMIESYSQMGSLTNITVMNYKYTEGPNGNGTYEEVKLNKKAVEQIKQIPGVVAAMPEITAWGLLRSGKYISDISIMAIDTKQAELFGITLDSGKMPSARSSGGTYEMVLGNGVISNFYDPKTGKQALDRDGNPKITENSRFQLTFDYNNVYGNNMDDGSTVHGRTYRLKPTGIVSASSNDFSWYCLMDIDALIKLAKENSTFLTIDTKNYNQVIVKCEDTEAVRSVKAAIDNMGFGTNSLQDWIDQSEKEIQKTQYLLGAIGGVSLLVAAIGIMNTMMMSIYERTKEIGIIKVLGCRMSNIAGLFLTESAYIGLFGGALGIGISYAISLLLNGVLSSVGLTSSIPLYLALGAVAFSVMVALISGLYPAVRAMKLSPLAAIRNE